MFNPTKTWRKWHRKINTNQKRCPDKPLFSFFLGFIS